MTWLLHVASSSTRQKHISHPKGWAGCSWEWPFHCLLWQIAAELLVEKWVVGAWASAAGAGSEKRVSSSLGLWAVSSAEESCRNQTPRKVWQGWA